MEGAKVYVQASSSPSVWEKATVVAALGNGRYRVALEAWEGDETVATGASASEIEVDASSFQGGSLPFQNTAMPARGFPDMTLLDHLHEAALLHNLRVRFLAGGCPYTYTADIVIAVNPYKWLPELYTDEKRKEYLVFDRAKLTPHVYATSSAAFSDLQESGADQSILVSGESGAGKTETVKIMMAHLALIASSEDSSVIRRIVESNPLLESFGNAQTVRNDNSSRFGKFIELELDGRTRLIGSRCRTFLLEKSRVVSQDAGERNYHIFYQMLAADPETRATFGLGDASRTRDTMRFTRLGKSAVDHIEGQSDSYRFQQTRAALALVGIEGEHLTTLLRALAGVLLVGELSFEGAGEDADAVISKSCTAEAEDTAAALQVDVNSLYEALTRRTLMARDEAIVKRLSAEAALATCEALAKELYTRIFDWLVTKICAATSAASQTERTIGLLDIFGFESFAINRFEQLCINYANEKLQQKFTLDIFKAVQQEYADEGIPWDRVEFKDNAPVLALIESRLGIVAMLNEECVRPKGSDLNFVSKLVSVHRDDPAFSTPRIGAQKEFQFSVKHYAGVVTYTSTGWLERNKDVVSDDLIRLFRTSSNSIIAEVFRDTRDASQDDDVKGTLSGKASSSTVATKFKTSLAQLMEAITRTRTQYIRCIKPNKIKSPVEMDNEMVVEQLRCAGVVEAIQVSRAGFPARMPLQDFASRFLVLVRAALTGGVFAQVVPDKASDWQALAAKTISIVSDCQRHRASGSADYTTACRAMMDALMPGCDPQFEIGRTRVYFKAGVLEKLEERRAVLRQTAASAIARRERGRRAAQRYRLLRRAALRLQSLERMRKSRAAFQRIRDVVIVVQSRRRGLVARREAMVRWRERCATRLQAFQRRRVAMANFARSRRAVVRIQSVVRRVVTRKRYLRNLVEFKEQAKLENQVRALQARLAEQEASGAAPEVLEALQALKAENAKLREELDKARAQNIQLRRDNKELRAEQSTRTDWLNFMRFTSKAVSSSTLPEEDRISAASPHPSPREPGHGRNLSKGSVASPAASAAAATAKRREAFRLYAPLSEYWVDLPCHELPMLASGTEVHLKFGPNVLVADGHVHDLRWEHWMDRASGYQRSQGFLLERMPSSSESHPGCLGRHFALRSSCSRLYVCRSGLLKGYRLQASAEHVEDAAAFELVPRCASDGHTAHSSHNSVEAHFCALRMQDGKFLSLRSDGYVSTCAAMPSADLDGTAVLAIECLLPCTSYEITIYEKQIGLVVAKDLPLKVAGFRSSADGGHTAYVPGPAERTGRVRIGDVITHVNGILLDGVPRQEALHLIAESRPVTLSLLVAQEVLTPR